MKSFYGPFFLITFLIPLILYSSLVQAAVIHGEVYSLDLELAQHTILTINTTPKQLIVARNATYSFVVQPGIYTILAEHRTLGSATTSIIITADGDYTRDFILYPDTQENLLNETYAEFPDAALDSKTTPAEELLNGVSRFIIVLAILAVGAVLFRSFRTKKTEKTISPEEDHRQHLLAFLSKEGGRTTQRELRTVIPLSEAKISLLLTELEHEGIIQKIKKGRGNIIIQK